MFVPPVQEAAVARATVAKARIPQAHVPKAHIPTPFPPDCQRQPPREYGKWFVGAARRHQTGPTACELARQAWQESRFKADARNTRSGACGISQFLPSTAKDFGIDCYNVKESVFAQAKYMAWQRKQWNPRLGDRTRVDVCGLALGGYNWGLGNMLNDQKRNGWILYADAEPGLPEETRGYVQIIGC